jgi:transglutaminase-like putative cysteine protease
VSSDDERWREEEPMMWRLRVVHSTGYAYKSPVTASFNEARLTPRSDNRQNVILNRVETVPATKSYRYVDYWGTAVTAFDLHAPHTELEVTSSSVVETDRGEMPADKVTWDDLRSEAVTDRFDEVLSPTHYTPQSKRMQRVAQRIAKYHDPQEAVIAAANWVHSELKYVPGTTGVHSSGLDALREGKGVCQDFAHLTLILLRSLGIPARYVSGYLHPKRKAVVGDTIDGQSHAWVQAWTGGWWDYDPTNDTDINEQYVSVAAGRDYSDVSPLKGIYSGEGSTDLDVVVEITRLA